MIDHVSIRVGDFEKSKKFYVALLGILSYTVHVEGEGKVGLRADDGSSVWIRKEDLVTKGMHFAFRASSKDIVDEFHKTGIAAGGVDNGKPGTRPHRGEQYIAFILDPDGNNIEVIYNPSAE